MELIKKIRFSLIVLLALISSSGTAIYGYKFSEYYFHNNPGIKIVFGIVLALIGMLSNTLLGIFSLLNTAEKAVKRSFSFSVLGGSLLSAIPTGFISFFGYDSMVPSSLNITISFIIIAVNTAINYTAVQFFIKSFTTPPARENNIFRICGYIIGMLVGLGSFLATTAGINDLLKSFQMDYLFKYHIDILVGVISYIPIVCLYSVTNKELLKNGYNFLINYDKTKNKINLRSISLLIFCLLSGTMLGQIIREFFSPTKNIPMFFKSDFMQNGAQGFIVLLAWLSGTGITFFCIKNLSSFKNKKS